MEEHLLSRYALDIEQCVRGIRLRARLAGALLCLCIVTCTLAQPVTYQQFTRNLPAGGGTGAGIARCYIAIVDLLDPNVEIVTTGRAAPGAGDAVLTTVPAWRTSVGARLAINANFFATLGGSRADIVGLCISDGVLVSPARQFGAFGDPALVFLSDRRARIDYIDPAGPAGHPGVVDAVAGVGPSSTDSDPGTLLVTNGVNTGATARVEPGTRNPRTAVGVNQDGSRLIIAVVDGRNTGSPPSVGMTLPELADLMLEYGAWRAVNLDGGGSSSFVWQPDSGGVIQNNPSDGSFRAVANHLGVRINPPRGSDGYSRPIRGAWIRPPSPVAGAVPPVMESVISNLAQAGLTDLFVETLYWGRDTGAVGMAAFPQHFGFDYLQGVIAIANRYNMRIHSWCETGYLDFGTNPSPLLAANPSWVVKHVSVARNEATSPSPCTGSSLNTLTGDLASQRFVNLGNPGVRTALNEYFSGLAQRYHGLEGIQADYHFFPLGNPPNNQNNVAPWSYDDWTLANFRNASGALVNPLASVTNCSGSVSYSTSTGVVSSGAHPNWINWNRANITEALRQLRESVDAVSPSPLFSAVSFGNWNDAIHLSKMIDLPRWGTLTGTRAFFIMAYGSTTTSINNELLNAQNALPGRRVVAGLANLVGSRPDVASQLNVAANRGLMDFCWFRAADFLTDGIPGSTAPNPNADLYRAQLVSWLTNSATPLRSDITANGTSNGRDGVVNANDLKWFLTVYSGSPVVPSPANARCDINGDGIIDEGDLALLTMDWLRTMFGDSCRPDGRALQALIDAFTPGPPPVPGILNRWDLNGDGAVNEADLWIAVTLFGDDVPGLDVNGDGLVNIDDFYSWTQAPTDVNADGYINLADRVHLLRALRGGEAQGMRGSQR
jgi:uncharacterized lipoprotein YddW (UPF0748 family)